MNQTQSHFHNKKIAIFGAGWLGTSVVQNALNLGMQVSTLTRNPEKSSQLTQLGVHNTITAQLHEDKWHDRIPHDQDYVVNCVSSAGNGLAGYRTSYLDGNASLLQWAGTTPHPAKFIYTGSTSVYSQSDGSTVHENSPTPEPSEAGQILLQTENLLQTQSPFSQTHILRLGGLYGPNRHYLLNLLRNETTELPGRGDLLLNLLHLEDATSAIFASLQAELPGFHLFNVTDGNPATKTEIVHWLAQQLHIPTPTFNPDITPSRSPIRQSAGKVPNRKISNAKICSKLGWNPQYPSFQHGYEALI
jgi:nucleoside-diphosphate-sugar epimerase